MIIVYCDKCGRKSKEMSHKHFKRYFKLRRSIKPYVLDKRVNGKRVHLCYKCAKRVLWVW